MVGFQVGWLVWLTRVTAFAALCNLLLEYLAHFWPPPLRRDGARCWSTGVVVVIAAVNIRGVRPAALVANVFTIGKLVPMVLFMAVGLFFLEPVRFVPTATPAAGDFSARCCCWCSPSPASRPRPCRPAKCATRAQPAVRDPGAMAVIVPLYSAVQVVCIGTLPELAGSTRPLADAAGRFAGASGAAVITVGALVSIAGTLNGLRAGGAAHPVRDGRAAAAAARAGGDACALPHATHRDRSPRPRACWR